MKQVFLESHNIKNAFTGFGQFNLHLISGLANLDLSGIEIILNAKNTKGLKLEFGDTFSYHKYRSITRHKPFRIKKKYDLWHCLNQNIRVEPFYNIPYLLTVHDVHFVTEGSAGLQKKRRKEFNEKLNRANAITYISEFTKQDVHKHFKVPDIPEYVIYNGNTILATTLPEQFEAPKVPEAPFLFSIGDFSERKNFMTLVEMLPHLPSYHLILAGNNKTNYGNLVREKIAANNLEDRVHLIGQIDDVEKTFYLKKCEAFVFPSLREGFGIPPIEAMRFGKPVFLSNSTSLPEIGGEQSFYWDHYEPEYMAGVLKKGMDTFYAHRNNYETWYIARAESFNWSQTAQQYLAVYKTILR